MNLPPTGNFRRRLLALILGERTALGRILLAAALEASFALAAPWLSKVAIDEALPNEALHLLAVVAGLGFVAAAYSAWTAWLHQRMTILLHHHLELTCLRDVLRVLLDTPYAILQKTDFGTTTETMAAVAGTVRATIQAGVSILGHGASGIASIVLLAIWFPGLALITVAVTAIGVLAAASFAAREAAYASKTLALSSAQQEAMYLALSGVPALRVAGATPRVLDRLRSLLHQHALASVKQQHAQLSRDLYLRASRDILVLLTMSWLGSLALRGTVSIGELITASLLVTSFTLAAKAVAELVLSFRAMRPHFARIDALLERAGPRSLPAPAEAARIPLAPREPRLRLSGIWFRYDASRPWVLADYSREFPAHRVTRLEAASGFGKSTILRLLSGLLEPEHGSVSIFGHEPRASKDWVTYLPQQGTLLEASIAVNLRTFSGEPLERVLEIAALTGLASLLERLPMGVETPVSAGGGNLSAGQQQLLRLTAAFASRRPVVLLDEPTSRLDDAAKSRIDWPRLTHDRTVVVVEHATSKSSRALAAPPLRVLDSTHWSR